MTKKAQNFEMWAGDSKSLVITVTGSSGAGHDLSGASVVWTLKENVDSASLIKRSTDSGCGISISTSTLTISLSPTHTENLSGVYYHEGEATDPTGDVSTLFVGTARIFNSGV